MRQRFTMEPAAVAVAALLITAVASFATAAPVRCTGAIQHPIQVRIEALDPIARGATVRLRLTTTAATGPVGRVEARIADAGGARMVGRARVALGRLERGAQKSTDFQVAVPASGARFLVQFVVEGEGPNGRLSRGATLNLLLDGPDRPARVVTNAAGERLAEYRAGRVNP